MSLLLVKMITLERPLLLFVILLNFQDIKAIEGAVFATDLCVYLVYNDENIISTPWNNTNQDVLTCCSSGNCVFNSLSDALVAATDNIFINLTTNVTLSSSVAIDHAVNITIDGVNTPTVYCTNTGSVHFISCSNVTIMGINWEGCGFNGGNTTSTYTSPAIQFYNSSSIRIQSCSFYNSTGQAVALSVVSDIWITSCQFSHNQYGGHGAAIHYSCGTSENPSLVINSCTFISNGLVKSVLYIDGSTGEAYNNISVQNSVFSDNQGVSINASHIHLHLSGDVMFQQNTADNGGAIFGIFSIIEVGNDATVYFSNNTANNNGGAVFLYNSNISFGANSSAQFKGNNANANGGSIFSESASIVSFGASSTATFTSNNASQYGGAIYLHHSNTSIVSSSIEFLKNSAKQYGGAIYLHNSDISVMNVSTVAFNNNSAPYGGAVNLHHSDISLNKNSSVLFNGNDGGAMRLYYSDVSANTSIITFTRNSAMRYRGGAIHARQHCNITFSNSVAIFDGNVAYYCGAVYAYSYTFISFNGHSIVEFTNSSARFYVGAVFIERYCQISICDTSVVAFNDNKNRLWGGGGAVSLKYYSDLSVANTAVVTFTKNSVSYDDGGAIDASSSCYISFGGASVVTFNNNIAGDNGGAISAFSSHISFSNTSIVTFNNNIARDYGGAISASSCQISISNTSIVTFNNNIARYDGGAIYIQSYTDISFNDTSVVTFVENRARSGGAICSAHVGSDITCNGTSVIKFLNNTASQYGGAVYIQDHSKILFDEHTLVKFHNNHAIHSNALNSSECSLWFKGNSMIVFIENSTASYEAVVYIRDSNAYFQDNTSIKLITSNLETGRVVTCTGNSLVFIEGNTTNFYINNASADEELFHTQQQCRIIHLEGSYVFHIICYNYSRHRLCNMLAANKQPS